MASNDYLLCIDIGANSIKAAEFSYSAEGEMLLERFAFTEYGGPEGAFSEIIEGSSSEKLHNALERILKENTFHSKKVNVSLSGHNAYIRFVKVPSMVNDEKKIKQIIEFEAKSAIPFEMHEVVWDSQLLNVADDNGEIEAMFVIVKSEEIERITALLESFGKQISLIEVAPTACYNAARLNGIGDSNCELILNIGDRCSSLLFVDNGRFFVRIIPIAGHAITLQISKEFGISYEEAEEMKRRHGFVALGGAYEEPDSEVAATVSKIVRNVMTRLHGEISRSINIYRSQQKGRKPEKLYLSGGSSVMGFTPRFFSEKLRIPVEYFNPFKNIAISPDIDKEKLADIAHMFSEPIGLALRHLMTCPVEISLVPQSLQRYLEFKGKIPFFYASAASLLLCLLVTFFGFSKQLEIANAKKKVSQEFLQKTKNVVSKLRNAESEFSSAKSEYEEASKILSDRKLWPNILNQVQAILPDDVWLTRFELSTQSGQKKGADSTRGGRNAPPPSPVVSDSLFAGLGGGGPAPSAPVDYISVYLEGHGLVVNNDFSERFTRKLSNSKFFVFNKNTDVIDTLQDGVFMDGAFNVATFKLTLKLTDPIKK